LTKKEAQDHHERDAASNDNFFVAKILKIFDPRQLTKTAIKPLYEWMILVWLTD